VRAMSENNFSLSDDLREKEFEEKFFDDEELMNDDTIDVQQLLEDAKEMRKILHMRSENRQRIINEFDKNIIVDIPDGTEDTLIRDLESFNNSMYGSEDSVFFSIEKVEEEEDFDEDELIEVQTKNEPEDYYDEELIGRESEKVLEPIEEVEQMPVQLQEEPEYDDTFEMIRHAAASIRKFSFLDGDEKITQVLEDKKKKIIVEDESQREQILNYVEKELDKGKFNLVKVKRPLYISGKRIHKKIKSIRQKFIDTYGSEIFAKVSDWIVEEQNLYQNLERIDRINKYKENKLKLAKQMQIREKLKRFFK
jgi:uncharacterized protein YktA (UPF0223 family)